MKRIKFTELGFKKNFDSLIVIVGIVCLIIGLIAVFGFLNQRFSGLAGFSAVLTTFPQLKTYFYKNYFLWNKRGGTIKINSKGKTIVFNKTESYLIENDKIILFKKNKTHIEFSLKDINKEDIEKVEGILNNFIKV
ncbi:hypothetical protein [Flavobacterium sp.]|uniref:hypothetical protein n=1 Tax=Flavobacterium sp. TaxID=239 RepID=UPI002619E7E4|nr:hypothetical protein [Flavobacterium sp.]MDD3005764.1 hypothetical protein [Flavobacterium sp.]